MKGDSIDVVKGLLDRIDEAIEASSGQPSLDSLLERISSIENSVERSTMETADVQQELLKLQVKLEAKELEAAELLSRSDGLVKQLEEKRSELKIFSTRLEAEGSARRKAEEDLEQLVIRLEAEGSARRKAEEELEQLAIRLEAEGSARKNAEEEGKLSLVQLHQVQEELEHYFLLSRRQFKMLEASTKLQERTAVLLAGANKLQQNSNKT